MLTPETRVSVRKPNLLSSGGNKKSWKTKSPKPEDREISLGSYGPHVEKLWEERNNLTKLKSYFPLFKINPDDHFFKM